MTDGLDHVPQPNTGEDTEDLDLFSSVGGLELGEDGFPQGQRDSEDSRLGGSIAGKYSCVERPSRTLYVQNITGNVEDSELRALFEVCYFLPFLLIFQKYDVCKHLVLSILTLFGLNLAIWRHPHSLYSMQAEGLHYGLVL